MKTVDNLKSLGYDVVINSGNIKLSYKGEGVPNQSIVLPLLEELKANKGEIIKTLQIGINTSKTTSEGVTPTVVETCSKCGSPAIFYEDSSGNPIFGKCNVHGARLKVTHAEIEAWSREKERNRNSNTDGDSQSRRRF